MYSVDFDIGSQFDPRTPSSANFLVTATHALFIGNGKHSAPVAVVGVQFRYKTLHQFFLKTSEKFNVSCTHMDVDCYLIDNNGFVVLSKRDITEVGRFFGLIDGDIMGQLVTENVFRRVHMYDYQAICLEPVPEGSGPAMNLFEFSIFSYIWRFFGSMKWLITFYVQTLYSNDFGWTWAMESDDRTVIAEPVRQDWGKQQPGMLFKNL